MFLAIIEHAASYACRKKHARRDANTSQCCRTGRATVGMATALREHARNSEPADRRARAGPL